MVKFKIFLLVLLLIVVIGIGFMFAAANPDEIVIDMIWQKWSVKPGMAMSVTLAVGILIGILSSSLAFLRLKATIKILNRRIKNAEQEVGKLRAASLT